MGTPRRLLAPIVMLCLLALHSTLASAQVAKFERITNLAAASTGHIEGSVMDEAGKPLDGVVISALGGTTAFAVSDKAGQFALKELPPGPYLLRAHLLGFHAPRSTMVNVRPAARSASTFTLRREGTADAPRLTEAGAATAIGAPADTAAKKDGRDESEFAWRLRHLKRGVLRDADAMAGIPRDDDWFITDSFQFLGRAVGSSAKAATAVFSDLSLGGQVNLLTTGAFDNPLQLLQLDRTSSVAFFSLGAPVGTHGDWAVRAAMNQNDLSSWMLAGSYVVTAQVPHRYQVGMSYSLQRYEGGNTAAMMAVADTARNVGSVFAYDEWQVSRYLSVGYGANYAHYDYLQQGPSLFSPRLSATLSPTSKVRRAVLGGPRRQRAGRRRVPAADRAPPTCRRSAPSRRFRGTAFARRSCGTTKSAWSACSMAPRIGVRAFTQRIDDQTVTVFGLRQDDSAAATLGHYFVGAAGDATCAASASRSRMRCWRTFAARSITRWPRPIGRDTPRRSSTPCSRAGCLRSVRSNERIHDVTTSLQGGDADDGDASGCALQAEHRVRGRRVGPGRQGSTRASTCRSTRRCRS